MPCSNLKTQQLKQEALKQAVPQAIGDCHMGCTVQSAAFGTAERWQSGRMYLTRNQA